MGHEAREREALRADLKARVAADPNQRPLPADVQLGKEAMSELLVRCTDILTAVRDSLPPHARQRPPIEAVRRILALLRSTFATKEATTNG
jgi:hypothetical protein